MELDEIWLKALAVLEARVSRPTFEALVKPAQPVSLLGDQMVVHTPNDFARDWLTTKYAADIAEAIRESAGRDLQLTFVTDTALAERDEGLRSSGPGEAETETVIGPQPGSGRIHNLNPKYSFDSFVVGNHSRFAHAAAGRVADAPAKAYNPLFLYGGVGLGKTHLMHAIGHALLSRQPDTKVVYLSSEKFTNDLINSIRDHKEEEFRKRYRSIDLLLIDDIQFIEGKERTQEEFFHTFNALHEAGKQIVISADRQPKDITQLAERLRSRFEWGLIADIQPPDLETRIAILKKKAAIDALHVGNDVLEYIAASYQQNVRELEGAFIRVMAYASLTNAPVTVSLAQSILGAQVTKTITLDTIKALISDHFRIEPSDLIGKSRSKDIAWARQVAMYLARELTSSSLPKIGGAFGGRDHTTVMHAHDKIKKAIASSAETKAEIHGLITRLR